MAQIQPGQFSLADRLHFRKDWVFDPVPWWADKFDLHDIARLAVVQLKAQREILKVQEMAMEEALEIYSRYAG